MSNSGDTKNKSQMLPIAIGGIVFVVFVIIFSLQFGVFSSSNVTHIPVKSQAAEQAEAQVEEDFNEGDIYDYIGNYSEYVDFGEETDSSFMSAEDSLKQVAWYESQKNEIKQEKIELEREKARLQRLKEDTQFLLDRRTTVEDANLSKMAKLYESMKSEELVPILANLSDAQVSLLISKMKKQKASEVLGKLSPDRAARITQWMISLDME